MMDEDNRDAPMNEGRAEPTSRLPGFFRRTLQERLDLLVEQGRLTPSEAALLAAETPGLPKEIAGSMIENVIGVYALPMGLGTNFLINGREYVVPMVVEEPSIVAAVSHSALLVREAGGFDAECDEPMMIGQVQVVGCADPAKARDILLENKARILAQANAFHPNLLRRGGGAREVEVRIFESPQMEGVDPRWSSMVVLHLLAHTCDAMGANLINTMAEGVAPLVESLTGGKVHLRILSNLADRRLVRARCRIPVASLAWRDFSGEEVACGIVGASRFAEVDPYRAATHNKGVMNGVDALALATGNDWRAIEAGAHAWCARGGSYAPMAVWRVEGAYLVGRLEIPLQVGTVGGPTRLHPIAKLAYKLLDLTSAQELSIVMAAVGLAQNLAAIKALATEGIQTGHMALHARSVAATAGARGAMVDRLAALLIEEGEVKLGRAQELLEGLLKQESEV
jgi:hydroxymethylglutaryl-CoA reductase